MVCCIEHSPAQAIEPEMALPQLGPSTLGLLRPCTCSKWLFQPGLSMTAGLGLVCSHLPIPPHPPPPPAVVGSSASDVRLSLKTTDHIRGRLITIQPAGKGLMLFPWCIKPTAPPTLSLPQHRAEDGSRGPQPWIKALSYWGLCGSIKLDILRAEVGFRSSGEAERTGRWIQANEHGRQGMPRID